jgi:carbon monoxide dehydrogenase subunit G
VRLNHSFVVPVGVDEAWKTLLDVERIAPCMPGATLTDASGDTFSGTVKVKVGPITLTYKGAATFTEKDETAHRVRIKASGRDSRGGGTAAAEVTASLRPDDADPGTTKVDVQTDLNVTGKPAQFGRGMLVDVSGKILGQFADRLAAEIRGGGTPNGAGRTVEDPVAEAAGVPADEPAGQVASAPRPRASRTTELDEEDAEGGADSEEDAIDLLGVVGVPPAVRQFAPYAVGALVGAILTWLFVRGRRR